MISSDSVTHSPVPHPQTITRQAAGPPAPPAVQPTLESVYREHFDFAWRTLRHLGLPEESLQDAAQDMWMVVHRNLGKFEGRSTLRTWLFGIALNTARNHRRRQRRRPAHKTLDEEPLDEAATPEQELEGREALGLVQEFLETLSEPRRILFVTQLLDDLTAAETAEILGIPVSSVYDRVRFLRRSFRNWLNARGGGAQ